MMMVEYLRDKRFHPSKEVMKEKNIDEFFKVNLSYSSLGKIYGDL
jgi:hypothetical protein